MPGKCISEYLDFEIFGGRPHASAVGARVGGFAPPVPLSDGLDTRPGKILDLPLAIQSHDEVTQLFQVKIRHAHVI